MRRQSIAAHLILITSFQPFGQWKVNLSSQVAQDLKKTLNAEVCELPVVYDQAADAAIACFERLPKKPDVVLSLGEGSCALRLETAAANLDDTPKFPDNRGTVRKATTIVSGGPSRIQFTLPTEAMYCALDPADRAKITPSTSAGNYVCNNTAYRLARYFAEHGIPYGFIHVPHSGCDAAIRDPKRNAELIAKMLGALSNPDPAPACSLEFRSRLH